ncbi:hypothetical protein ACJJTC_018773 [Scirpophaga incertulas]
MNMEKEPLLKLPGSIETTSLNTRITELKQCPSVWQEERTATFLCRICRKTFYNATALQNHIKTQHDSNETKSGELLATRYIDQSFNEISSFKFIPLECNDDSVSVEVRDGLTTRVFAEDTSYLIVKVEGAGGDKEVTRKAHQENAIKKTPAKSLVDLRGPFTCTFPLMMRPDMQCRQIFFNCCDYSIHYREEHTKRRKAALRCQVCEKPLDKEQISAVPERQYNQISLSCRFCGQAFLDSTQLDEHVRAAHGKMKPFECSVCAKRFTQQGGLQQHLRMHTGIRPFTCTYCPKAFTQKAGLEQHLRTHTKIKPFRCVICAKCFSQSVHLRQHMRTHTNIQPFKCPFCERKFKQSSHLNFHMRSHFEEAGFMPDVNSYGAMQVQNQMKFFNLANVQPVHVGDTMYYAAELASDPDSLYNPLYYQPCTMLPESILPI